MIRRIEPIALTKNVIFKVILWIIHHSTSNKERLLQVLYYIFESHSNILFKIMLHVHHAVLNCQMNTLLYQSYIRCHLTFIIRANLVFNVKVFTCYPLKCKIKTFIQRINGYIEHTLPLNLLNKWKVYYPYIRFKLRYKPS